MSARALSCPGCGGGVTELARLCPYCHASVATVRCGHCFHMNVADALHCSGCGHELGLEPIAEGAELTCPDCKQPLTAFRAERGALFDCGRCGGQLVEHALLRELLERREVLGAAVPRRPQPPAPRSVVPPVRYIRCPACSATMNRKNFGGSSGVIVDICKKDGIWFDGGELPRVLAFVDSGGLARAARREQDERAADKRAELVRAVSTSSAGSAGYDDPEPAIGLLDFLIRL